MTELYKIFVDYTLWPILIAILCYLWNELVSRVKSIENRSVRMEKDIVRISTLLESLNQ